jgi:hypothetical protein
MPSEFDKIERILQAQETEGDAMKFRDPSMQDSWRSILAGIAFWNKPWRVTLHALTHNIRGFFFGILTTATIIIFFDYTNSFARGFWFGFLMATILFALGWIVKKFYKKSC